MANRHMPFRWKQIKWQVIMPDGRCTTVVASKKSEAFGRAKRLFGWPRKQRLPHGTQAIPIRPDIRVHPSMHDVVRNVRKESK